MVAMLDLGRYVITRYRIYYYQWFKTIHFCIKCLFVHYIFCFDLVKLAENRCFHVGNNAFSVPCHVLK